jgi:hypothetical protein
VPAQASNSTLNTQTPVLKASADYENDSNLLYARIKFLSPWFPQVDPNHPRAQTLRTWRSRQDVLLTTATLTSVSVLVIEIMITIILQSKYRPTGGVVSMYEGSCSWVKNVDIVAHLLINGLSTLLLGASNLCMQLLAAPTREEIDEAHSKKMWLDIGVPSWRNLKSVARSRRLTWFILGLSSVPLHFMYVNGPISLLIRVRDSNTKLHPHCSDNTLTIFATPSYNSAVSSSLASYGYAAAVVNEKFIHENDSTNIVGPQFNSCQHCSAIPEVQGRNSLAPLSYMRKLALDGHTLVNRTKIDCLQVFADMYGDRTNLLIVTRDTSDTQAPTILQYAYVAATWAEGGTYWPCDDGAAGGKSSDWAGAPDCGKVASVTTSNLDHWKKFDRPVLYCLSQRPTGYHCRLNYSPTIMTSIPSTLI